MVLTYYRNWDLNESFVGEHKVSAKNQTVFLLMKEHKTVTTVKKSKAISH